MKVVITDPIADAGVERLREAGHTVEAEYEAEGEELLDVVADANALIVRSGTTVDASVFEAADDLVVVGRAGIGVDNIDIDAATEHGVIVANAPDPNVRATAEHTIGMLFAAARSIPQAHQRLKAGEWAKGDYLGTEINDKTLGIVGLGRVGQQVAKKCDSLGMDLVAFDPYIPEERAEKLGVELVEDLDECLRAGDFITIHTPLTPETEGLIGAEEFELLDGGYVVNCARGGIIDEDALADAVLQGNVDGAALDVYKTEPLPEDSPLLEVDEIVTTPHLGASTESAQTDVALLTADQVIAALNQEPVTHALNAPSVDESTFGQIQPYIDIAETAGRVATQMLDGRISTVEVTYSGEIAEEDIELVTASALKGIFEPLQWKVNAVNAEKVANDRGVEVIESKTRQAEDFQSVVRVTVGNDDNEVHVDGTLFADNEPRIVRIDDFRVDAIPYGRMLVVDNYDEPGAIGHVGTVLGEHEINIAGMFNGRETIGGEAMTVYNLDDQVPEEVIDELESDERIIKVTQITLQERDEEEE
ncbi:phosphoglycerate dehydrogenase [Salinarchaeum sp. IM2453]|uniref:phosphoglycerate dehydrogenase n=1 Tax=Salinarchaeum sp. IM2453 TaxID=2862870 RepID=UPI001C82AA36|nr:phosphoglycerate dehydrogenase [Salinarchaeum sp. IM2453]QZA89403.1 phosphoglycerate dehydrogenase [Salinarchaeum sp. IM2453]